MHKTLRVILLYSVSFAQNDTLAIFNGWKLENKPLKVNFLTNFNKILIYFY